MIGSRPGEDIREGDTVKNERWDPSNLFLAHVLAAGFSAWCTNLKTGRMYRFNRTALTRVEIDETKPTAQTTITDSRSEVVSVQRIGPENRKRRP